MGQEASTSKPGTEFQVIGAGLSRTGTSSFNVALSILLDGPTYHGGTQSTLGPPHEIRSWITLLSHWPPKTANDSTLVNRILKERLSGYAAVTDAPCYSLVPELLALYPNALVICTVRDPDAWMQSMATIANASTLWFLRFVLFPLPTMRYFPDLVNVLRKQWVTLYGKADPVDMDHWNRHIEYLKRVVPAEKLVFFDVREGWEPLCRALGKEVPDVPFPRINDSKAIDELAQKMIVKGLVRWAGILGTAGVALVGYWFVRM